MADTPQVAVVANASRLSLPAPQTNPALDLAQSLSGVNDALGPALEGYAKLQQRKQSAKAQADALATSGQAFSDAVKAGKLRPTQNPYYIQSYVEKAAAVRGQAAGAQLVSDSQTWAERSDPKAFAQRWTAEVGKLAETYAKNPFEMHGFTAAMDPISQQTLNSNLEYNAQRIVQENVQNTTQLMSSALENVYKANPKAAPSEYYAAIQPLLDTWHNTGGTEPQANELIKGAFGAAASQVGDGDMLDALKYDRGGGKGSIYNIVSANGDPYSADIEQTRYRIIRMQEIQGMGAVKKIQAQQELEGHQFLAQAYGKWGFDLVNGKVSMQDMIAYGKEVGVSPQGVQAALRIEARDLSENDTYMSAQTRQYARDPSNQDTILSLRTQAMKSGWTAGLEQRVWEQVRLGMDEGTANDILSKADSTSKYFHSESKADQREARSQANFDRSQRAAAQHDFKAYRDQSVGQLDMTLQASGDMGLTRPEGRAPLVRGVTDAGNAWLRSHPDDYTGAQTAMDGYLDAFAKRRLARLRGRSGQGTNGGGLQQGNPRGGK